jgi:hypothetical protein
VKEKKGWRREIALMVIDFGGKTATQAPLPRISLWVDQVQEDPARNRPDGRPRIFQSEVQRVELVYHTDYIYELTDRLFICPGFSLHSTRHLPGYGSFPGVFLPRNTQ